MTSLLKPGDPFLYMKVGVHANESLKDIIERKRAEIKQAGVAFWGYGGSSCHPLNAVQPFVKQVTDKGITVRLFMQEITSRHYAEGEAKQYSADGKTYLPVPKGIKVLGSRYALVLSSLDQVDLQISLTQTTVGVGRLLGSSGSAYIRGHVDKACLVFDPSADEAGNTIQLRLAGNMAAPYAVVLK